MKSTLFQWLLKAKLFIGYYRTVEFSDQISVQPVSRLFGLDRGQPIDRFYVEHFLAANREVIHGRILEVAGDSYARQFADRKSNPKPLFETLHVEAKGNPTLTGNLTDSDSLPTNRYDCFICTQTYNFIYELRKAITGTYHLLKNDGVVLATVAGISQISRYDMERWGDYWRFTNRSMALLFEEVFGKENVEVVTYGNVLAATALLRGLCVEDLPDIALLDEMDPDYQVIIGIRAKKSIR